MNRSAFTGSCRRKIHHYRKLHTAAPHRSLYALSAFPDYQIRQAYNIKNRYTPAYFNFYIYAESVKSEKTKTIDFCKHSAVPRKLYTAQSLIII